MDQLTFQVEKHNGIEFYVSNDGKTTGMSVRGLARCCGVSSSSITAIVGNDGVIGKTLPQWLESYTGQVFEGDRRDGLPLIISSKVCARIINYYAYESKNAKNETARKTAETFVVIGIDNWIKDLAGFKQEITDEKRLTQAINVLVNTVGELKIEVEELKPIVKKYNNLKNGVTVKFPGVETIVNDLEGVTCLPNADDMENATLSEWLATKNVTLDKSGLNKLGRTVAATFRSCKLEEPKKANRKKPNGKWSNNVIIYNREHFPILEMAFNQFVQI